jgi:hypothetical protein
MLLSVFALRVTPLFALGCVAPRPQIASDCGAFPKLKIDSHAASPVYEMASKLTLIQSINQ